MRRLPVKCAPNRTEYTASDGAECAIGTDPASAASKPPVAALPHADHGGLADAVDTDADKVNDGVECKRYVLSPTASDTDGDGCGDGRQIASVNTDNNANSLDMLTLARNVGSSCADGEARGSSPPSWSGFA